MASTFPMLWASIIRTLSSCVTIILHPCNANSLHWAQRLMLVIPTPRRVWSRRTAQAFQNNPCYTERLPSQLLLLSKSLSQKSMALVHACNFRRRKEEDKEFSASLGSILSSSPTWITWDSINKQTNEQKMKIRSWAEAMVLLVEFLHGMCKSQAWSIAPH